MTGQEAEKLLKDLEDNEEKLARKLEQANKLIGGDIMRVCREIAGLCDVIEVTRQSTRDLGKITKSTEDPGNVSEYKELVSQARKYRHAVEDAMGHLSTIRRHIAWMGNSGIRFFQIQQSLMNKKFKKLGTRKRVLAKVVKASIKILGAEAKNLKGEPSCSISPEESASGGTHEPVKKAQ
jgi:hypothetical protein